MKPMHGYAQQGVAYGYDHTKGLNAQLATISAVSSGGAGGGLAPVIAAARLRKGNVASAHGVGKIVGEAVATARAAGAHTVVVRADSAYYGAACVQAAARAGSTSPSRRGPTRASAPPSPASTRAWTPIRYPHAIFDEEDGRSGAGRRALHRHRPPQGRAPVSRPGQAPEPRHRRGRAGRAVHHLAPPRGLHRRPRPDAHRRGRPPRPRHRRAGSPTQAGPIAHLPSAPTPPGVRGDLLRAAGHLGRILHPGPGGHRAGPAIAVPARIARSARRARRLPTRWPWAEHWQQLAPAHP